jgi:hypothetical protein
MPPMDAEGAADAAHLEQRLGAYALGAGRDVAAAAALVAGETVGAVAVAAWQRRGWVVVATDAGLRLARRPWILGRRRELSCDWAEMTSMRSGPQRVAMRFGDTEVDLFAVSPHDEFVRLLETARAVSGGGKPSVEELRALAEQKLGRLATYGFEATIDGLPEHLRPGEDVQRMTGAATDFDGLLVLTDRRLLLLDDGPLRRGKERCWQVARQDIRAVLLHEDRLEVVLDEGTSVLTRFLPPERLLEFADALGARAA